MFLTIKERYLDSGIDWTTSPQPEECRVNYVCKQFICWVADSPLCCTLIKTCRMQTVSSSSQPHSFSYPTFMFNLDTQSIAAPGNRNIQPTPYLKIWYQSRPLVCGTIGVCLDLQAKVNAKAAKAHLQIAITTLFEAAIFTLFRSADREIQNAGRPIHSVRNLLES